MHDMGASLTTDQLRQQLSDIPVLGSHSESNSLIEIVTGETHLSTSGYPYISDQAFCLFRDRIPHLFGRGQSILGWLRALADELVQIDGVDEDALESVRRAIKVLRTVVYTAGVTAPSDLWLMRQVLSAHKEVGTIGDLLSARDLIPEDYARDHHLSSKQLSSDLRFMYSRGLLGRVNSGFCKGEDPGATETLERIGTIAPEYRTNMAARLADWFASTGSARKRNETFLRSWLDVQVDGCKPTSWIATHCDLEVGYRLLPLVLGLRAAGLTGALKEGVMITDHVPVLLDGMSDVLQRGGLIQEGMVTELGGRVFERGPGPFGIIGAYHAYMNNLDALLNSQEVGTWVHRGENVAASQDANRKTFEVANARLDTFCKKYDFQYSVFIEHAVGQGEATRQRYEADGEKNITFVGADLEDAAIDRAIEQQKQGALPRNMLFVRGADIGKPERVIDFLVEKELSDQPTVMVVGNGFHEIRNQTNEKMVEVFRAYEESGFFLIFTEESGLEDDDLLATAWNTYHAGFRYVHDISGQGLRPARERSRGSKHWNWRTCATLGGYVVVDELCYRTRTIYPCAPPDLDNPSISETYFCVPYRTASALGVVA